MRILWITNTIFPAPSELLGIPAPIFGGWMYGIAKHISNVQGIRLAIATVYNEAEYKSLTIDGIVYYLLPKKTSSNHKKNAKYLWEKICNEFKPDIIHIHGTEYPYGLACMQSKPMLNYVVSIQGLVSVYSRYYFAGMTNWDIIKHITFRDIVRFDSLFNACHNYEKRGEFEKEYLLNIKHVIGRTSWDFAHTKAINPNLSYHFCNESLRDSFYISNKWDIKNKTNLTIFLSQSQIPLKGIHQVLKAVALLKKDFQNIKVRIAGQNIIKRENFVDKITFSGYSSYIRSLINRLSINENVQFLGILTEEMMIAEYKKAHIFICPSSIENSPNSLGEAQIIGVPCIATYVGGIPDMIEHGNTGLLYRFEEIEMLVEDIRKIFYDDKLALHLSLNGIKVAEERHNYKTNLNNTIEIYKNILST